jgi:hypothetical protein
MKEVVKNSKNYKIQKKIHVGIQYPEKRSQEERMCIISS